MKRRITKAMEKKLANHKFDASKYVVLKMSVRRDSRTGRLVVPSREPTKK